MFFEYCSATHALRDGARASTMCRPLFSIQGMPYVDAYIQLRIERLIIGRNVNASGLRNAPR
ncbi:protein of unknown function [Pararobbsia alpina]